MSKQTFGKRLTLIREAIGLSATDLATKANVSRMTINHLENDKRDPQLATLVKLADALNVDIDTLAGRKPYSKTT